MPKNHPRQIVDLSQDAAYNSALSQQPHNPQQPFTSQYKFTWMPDKLDRRDFRYTLGPNDAPKVDLRRFCGPVEDQGNLGSCTGHATTAAMEIILRKQNRFDELSRLFAYYQARLLEGTVNRDAGAYLRNCIKACNKFGTSLESLHRYDIRLFRNRPSVQAYRDAERRKVTQYERCDNFDSVKNALSNGNPVVAGFLVYTSFLSPQVTRTGMMPYPNTRRERVLGGHAVCLVGFDDGNQRFIVRNSWGTNWGDGGYFYMPYEVIRNPNMSGDFWVIRDITR